MDMDISAAARRERSLNRRGFLKLSVLAGGATLLAACQPTAPAAAPTAAPATAAPAKPASTAAPASAGTAAPATGSTAAPTTMAELQEAARKEGRVSVYGPPGTEYRRVYVEGWQKAYPDIQIDYSGANGSEQAPKLAAERQGGKFLADIYTGGPSSPLRTILPINGFDPLEPVLLPEVKSGWFQNKLWYADDTQKFYVTFAGDGGGRGTLIYNTKEVDPKTITSWNDFLQPRWVGKLVSADIGTGAVGGGLTALAYSELGQDYIRKLFAKEQGVVMTADARQQVDWVAQGQYLVGLFASDYLDAIKTGIPVGEMRLAYPGKRLLGVGFAGMGLVNQAPHPNAARLYLNWFLGKDGQVAYQNALREPSFRTDVTRENVDPLDIPDPNSQYELNQSSTILGLRTEVEKMAKELASRR